MTIKKLGHCCLVIETKGIRIMTDPGNYSTLQNEEKNIDLILITHEHLDHFHIESLLCVLKNNPDAQVVTNASVGKLLKEEGISYQIVDDGKTLYFKDVLIEGFGKTHEEIYETVGQVENTGYFVDNTFFYPGDAFCDPCKPVAVLALPVAGPWMHLRQAITYAKKLQPKKVFPVHDGMLVKDRLGPVHRIPRTILEAEGVEWVDLLEGDEKEF